MRGPATITDELTHAASANLVRGAGYVAVHTLEFPGYHGGNMLVLDHPPTAARFPEWVAVWGRELGRRPDLERFVVQWETGPGEPNHLRGYLEGALVPAPATVHTLGTLRPLERPATAVEIRPLGAASDWDALAALTVANTEVQYPGQAAFGIWRAGAHRENCDAGRARWWGAFDAGVLTGSAGLYESGDWARFADVITHPGHRRRGIATTLVHAMCTDLHTARPDVTVVIVSTPGSQAERLYHQVGFEPVGIQWEISAPRQALRGPIEE